MYASSNYSGKKIYSEKKNKPTIRLTITNFENEGHLFKKNKLFHTQKKERVLYRNDDGDDGFKRSIRSCV